jgi:POT family proton-dependent oligopeptide transporter
MSSQPTSGLPRQRTFLGHPLGLYVLFFTEMWERFSYYGMRALLILYMLNYFKWSQQDASTIYKVYTSFVYVTPILGGFLADRYLGNRKAVVIGAALMAIGHFLMAFEEYPIFLSALIFLILGNGMFKPNMSTQVGRLYPTNDGRRDGAYTIFYMGINLGAFLSPLACGWLAEHTQGGYHSGFTLAGIGMVCGLLIYVLGQPLIREIDPAATPAAQEAPTSSAPAAPPPAEALTEAEAEAQPSVLGAFARFVPVVLTVLGALVLGAAPILWHFKVFDQWDAIMLATGGGCLLLVAYVCAEVRGGVRDRVLAILVLGVFVMFFWAAYEQAGNVLNVWADKNTDRFLWRPLEAPQVVVVVEDAPKADGEEPAGSRGLLERFRTMFLLKPARPGAAEQTWGEWFDKSFNPVPTAWFQSINALAIFVIAPIFAWLWIWLDRRGMQPSIAMKMVLGLVLMSASVAIMVAAAKQENKITIIPYKEDKLPTGLTLGEGGEVAQTNEKTGKVERFHAGRLTFDPLRRELQLNGVLPDNERDLIIEKTAPAGFRKKVEELAKLSKKIDGDKVKSVSVKLDKEPPGFNMQYAGLKKSVVSYDPKTRTLTAYQPLQEKEVKALLVAAGEPGFRDTMHKLFVEASVFRVSYWWLFWSYILATLGELCLSPVGLSMVSKLAPARFATMLMGVWMLTSAFGNFAAGWLGEVWGRIPPTEFFWWTTGVVGVAALVLLALVRWVVAMMHGVK